MLHSMTGFGSAAGEVEGILYEVEIRSVNNRYLKVYVRLPESWSAAEAQIEQRLRGRLSRGTVTCTVRMKVPEERAAHKVNVPALNYYLEQLRRIETDADAIMRLDLSSLLELPGVCEPPDIQELVGRTRDGLMGLVGQAVDELVEMRRREGESVAADLAAQCDAGLDALENVRGRAANVVEDYRQRLAARVRELTGRGDVSVDDDALAREVAIFAERCDIAEEISRLREHLQAFRAELRTEGPGGRKMDFIAQEMLREANTIASKANDADIARWVVEIKTAIDRIKEQVQNVE